MAGPLYPLRSYGDTDLQFVKLKVLHRNGTPAGLKKVTWPEHPLDNAICGIQVTMVPDKKNGIEFFQQLIATAFFIAPGVAISTWHVFKDYLPEPVNGKWENAPLPAEFQIVSFGNQGSLSVWPISSFSVGEDANGGSDLTSIGCHLHGDQPVNKVHGYLETSARFPAIGERLHMRGFKESSPRSWNEYPIRLTQYESAGTVIEVYPNGRGNMPRGPCFCIDSGATGGMSGAPVFDNNGLVIGVLSTGNDDPNSGYSVVSSVAPIFSHKITQTWRPEKDRSATIREILTSA
ncbi:MAG: hypothetical protein R3D56_00190 [Paracoccaceae bacterium]